MLPAQNDELFMRAALQEARESLGQTSPNPAVGALLVIRGRIVARGRHRQAGRPHAEVECLGAFGRAVHSEATLYVTLEPCSTVGRTPACTDAIIKSGVKKVVIGAIDVNPRHAGHGIDLLRQAGIEVRTGILAGQCALLNEAFNKWIVTGRPFVTAKCGMSLDGRLTRPPKESRWITSAAARHHAHALRASVDAILIGAETVRKDDPRLTVRGQGRTRPPLRVVITRSGNLPRRARLFSDRFAERTVIYRRKSMSSVLRDLGKKEVTSLLIEGGGDVLGRALDEKIIDKVQIYLGPIFSGGPVVAFAGRGANSPGNGALLERVQYQRLGRDLCVIGYPRYAPASVVE